MILYFSGTGNSCYVATELGSRLNLEVVSITEADIARKLEAAEDTHTIFVFPTYSWGVPPIMLDFIKSMDEKVCRKIAGGSIVGVSTCGDETAMTPEMLAKALGKKNLRLDAFFTVIMPNNYVLLPGFDVDSEEVEKRKIAEAPDRINLVARRIRAGFCGEDIVRGPWPQLKTRLVYPLFRHFGIFPSKWKANDDCINCGRCADACPVRNIVMKNGHPVWGADCTSCLACYHVCPRHAVNYGRATRHKGQYFFK